MEVTIECPLCSAEHEYEIEPGEPTTRWYPGSGPIAWLIERGCDCAMTCGNEIGYRRQMEKRALSAARESAAVAMESPFDTLEEMRGER